MSMTDMFPATAIADTKLSLPLLWLQLHQDASMTFGPEGHRMANSDDIEAFNIKTLRQLKNISAGRWFVFCEASGWTTYGAIATTWCQDAEVSHLLEGWQAAQIPMVASEEYDRPIRMIQQDILPKNAGLSELTLVSRGNLSGLCMLVRAANYRISWNIPDEQLMTAPAELVVVLLDNMAIASMDKTQERKLLRGWAEHWGDGGILDRIRALERHGFLPDTV